MSDKTSTTTIEVYKYTDEFENEQLLAVEPLRRWAESNCELRGIPLDIKKVEDMFANKKIDRKHLQQHTMTRDPRPIIVCEDFGGMASEIVDGNHTYAAMATAVAIAARTGFPFPTEPTVPGYVITRKQMEQFIIPSEARLTGIVDDQ
ncbi:hypothetical protein [Ruegeria sp. Ofav3-42]|uniref:hypothetical protein n=1 Tax=Ruegeria sp. Ofav3-42 TaxID=2917759 RepID=UPI001EF4BE31|nr:hypothetical protein [Ruegeria sp. Ofav3-42]MCG7522736.1 hypothetical protein [Ruegeria sp. Ofav3-42]